MDLKISGVTWTSVGNIECKGSNMDKRRRKGCRRYFSGYISYGTGKDSIFDK